MSTEIDAPPARVWAEIAVIDRHVDWMEDAVAIRFITASRSGPGTQFDCDTKVGPFRLTDRMTVTEWDEGRMIGIDHTGLVTGAGRLSVRPSGSGRTEFVWEERLRYPWWMGGRVGGVVIDRVMTRLWRRNLRNLKRRVEA